MAARVVWSRMIIAMDSYASVSIVDSKVDPVSPADLAVFAERTQSHKFSISYLPEDGASLFRLAVFVDGGNGDGSGLCCIIPFTWSNTTETSGVLRCELQHQEPGKSEPMNLKLAEDFQKLDSFLQFTVKGVCREIERYNPLLTNSSSFVVQDIGKKSLPRCSCCCCGKAT